MKQFDVQLEWTDCVPLHTTHATSDRPLYPSVYIPAQFRTAHSHHGSDSMQPCSSVMPANADILLLMPTNNCIELTTTTGERVLKSTTDCPLAAVPMRVLISRLTPPLQLTHHCSRSVIDLMRWIADAMHRLPPMQPEQLGDWFSVASNSLLTMHILPQALSTITASLLPAFSDVTGLEPVAKMWTVERTKDMTEDAMNYDAAANQIRLISIPTANAIIDILGPNVNLSASSPVPRFVQPRAPVLSNTVWECIYANDKRLIQQWMREMLQIADRIMALAAETNYCKAHANFIRLMTTSAAVAHVTSLMHFVTTGSDRDCTSTATTDKRTNFARRFPFARARIERASAMSHVLLDLTTAVMQCSTRRQLLEEIRPIKLDWLSVFSDSHYTSTSGMVGDALTREGTKRLGVRRQLDHKPQPSPRHRQPQSCNEAYHVFIKQQQTIARTLAEVITFLRALGPVSGRSDLLAQLNTRWSSRSAVAVYNNLVDHMGTERQVMMTAWHDVLNCLMSVMLDTATSTIFLLRSKTRGTFQFGSEVLHNMELRLLQCTEFTLGISLCLIDFAFSGALMECAPAIALCMSYINGMAMNHITIGILPLSQMIELAELQY